MPGYTTYQVSTTEELYDGSHNKITPVYLVGDLNAANHDIGSTYVNQIGIEVNTRVINGSYHHLDPDFHAFYSRNSQRTCDIVLRNSHATHCIIIEPGPIKLSDHIPVTITLINKALTKKSL